MKNIYTLMWIYFPRVYNTSLSAYSNAKNIKIERFFQSYDVKCTVTFFCSQCITLKLTLTITIKLTLTVTITINPNPNLT